MGGPGSGRRALDIPISGDASDFQKAGKDAVRTLTLMTRATMKFSKAGSRAGKRLASGLVKGVIGSSKKILSSFARVGTSLVKSGLSIGLNLGKSILSGLSNALATAGKVLAVSFAGVTAAITAGVIESANFTAAIANVGTIAGKTGKELKQIRDLAIEFGSKTAFSAKEAASALTNFASSGITSAENMRPLLSATLDLAAALGTDLDTASRLILNNIKAMGAQFSEATNFADVMSNAFTKTEANADRLSVALRAGAPAAQVAGQSFESVVAVLSKFFDVGTEAGQAGIIFAKIMNTLIKPTTEGKKAIKELGLQMSELNPEANDVIDVLARLEKANLSAAQAQSIFGQEFGLKIVSLIRKGVGSIRTLRDSLTKSGTTARLASERMDNLSGDVKNLFSAFEGLRLINFKPLEDALRPVAKAITTGLTNLKDWAIQTNFVERAVEKVKKAAKDIFNSGPILRIRDILNGMTLENLKKSWEAIFSDIKNGIRTIKTDLSSGFFIEPVKKFLKTLSLEFIISIADTVLNGIIQFGEAGLLLINKISNFIAKKITVTLLPVLKLLGIVDKKITKEIVIKVSNEQAEKKQEEIRKRIAKTDADFRKRREESNNRIKKSFDVFLKEIKEGSATAKFFKGGPPETKKVLTDIERKGAVDRIAKGFGGEADKGEDLKKFISSISKESVKRTSQVEKEERKQTAIVERETEKRTEAIKKQIEMRTPGTKAAIVGAEKVGIAKDKISVKERVKNALRIIDDLVKKRRETKGRLKAEEERMEAEKPKPGSLANILKKERLKFSSEVQRDLVRKQEARIQGRGKTPGSFRELFQDGKFPSTSIPTEATLKREKIQAEFKSKGFQESIERESVAKRTREIIERNRRSALDRKMLQETTGAGISEKPGQKRTGTQPSEGEQTKIQSILEALRRMAQSPEVKRAIENQTMILTGIRDNTAKLATPTGSSKFD